MSVLIWCSYFAVSLLGFEIFLIALRMLLQEKVNSDFAGKSFPQSFLKAMLLIVSSLSLDQILKSATLWKKEQKISERIYLVLLAFSPLSLLIPLVLLFLLLMNFSGAWLGAIGLILWILSRFVPRLEKRSLIFIGWSVFAIGFELTLKQSALLMNAAPDQPWIYWLGDSSILSCVALLIAGGLATFLVRLPYLTVLISACLLLSGIISLPSALCFVFGEILLWFIWSKSGALRTGIFAGVSLLFILIFPLYLPSLNFAFGREYSVLLRLDQFFVSLGLWLALDLVISMGVFHYFSLNRAGQTK